MSDNATKLAIHGAAGRMGQRLIALAKEDARFDLAGAIETADHPFVGKEIEGVSYSDHLVRGVDVVVDFSLPRGTQAVAAAAMNDKTAMIIGTTGLSKNQQGLIDEAAREVAVVQAANYSVGVNVLLRLVAEAGRILGDAYDIEIVETHHRFKQDAPSGTALALAHAICAATDKDPAETLRDGRSGQCLRQSGEIGMHAVRLGDTVGEHAVHFGTLGETVTISHSAHTRDTFAAGALRAAAWVIDKPPGKYDMRDVLFGQ